VCRSRLHLKYRKIKRPLTRGPGLDNTPVAGAGSPQEESQCRLEWGAWPQGLWGLASATWAVARVS
jgi:hypothetical protein